MSSQATTKKREPVKRKLVIVGDGACGKSSLLTEYIPTVFENYVTDVKIADISVQLALWDTAGQEEYERLRPLSYSKANVILIAFAIDTPDSLDNVTAKWILEVNQECQNVPVVLVGLKKDLRDRKQNSSVPPTLGIANAPASESSLDLPSTDSQRRPSVTEEDDGNFVQPKQAEKIAKEIGARKYLECSALTGEGVDDVFECATRAALLMLEEKQDKCCVIL